MAITSAPAMIAEPTTAPGRLLRPPTNAAGNAFSPMIAIVVSAVIGLGAGTSIPLVSKAVIDGPIQRGDAAGIVPLEQMEREMVVRAMRAAGDNQTRAAELLGVSRDQLRYRLKKFGLREDEAEA